MSELMGRNEYARHRGCSPNAVKKAEDDGRIAKAVVRDTDGTFIGIKWRLADELWALNTDPEQQLRGNGGVMPAAPVQPELLSTAVGTASQARESEAERDADRDADRDELVRQRIEKARLENEMAELELAKRRGELVSLADEREVRARRYRALRDKLQGVADRLAPRLREFTDELSFRAALQQEHDQALHELSDDARAELARGAQEPVAA